MIGRAAGKAKRGKKVFDSKCKTRHDWSRSWQGKERKKSA
jgi:hypothetical protein